MDDETWQVKRRRELEAMAPVKRKKVEPFVKVPLWWAQAAAKATNTQKALVWIVLLHTAWKAKSSTFPLPNGRLAKVGVGRFSKYRVLRELEDAGLIVVIGRRKGKTPSVTLLHL
jgi:hypothetical protein